MSKGLEALESIIESFYDKESEDIQIVRKELKEYEKLSQDIFPHPKENGEEYRQLAIKMILALEIIKNKIPFDEGWEIFLSKEEKDLVEEVLKGGKKRGNSKRKAKNHDHDSQ